MSSIVPQLIMQDFGAYVFIGEIPERESISTLAPLTVEPERINFIYSTRGEPMAIVEMLCQILKKDENFRLALGTAFASVVTGKAD